MVFPDTKIQGKNVLQKSMYPLFSNQILFEVHTKHLHNKSEMSFANFVLAGQIRPQNVTQNTAFTLFKCGAKGLLIRPNTGAYTYPLCSYFGEMDKKGAQKYTMDFHAQQGILVKGRFRALTGWVHLWKNLEENLKFYVYYSQLSLFQASQC